MNNNRLHRGMLILVILPMMAACGFKLRGESVTLPPDWNHVAIEYSGTLSAHNGLVEALERRLQEAHGVRIESSASIKAPRIVVLSEQFRTPVSALDNFGRASEYLLEYSVRYQFLDQQGKPLAEASRIYLRREQSYSSAQILAKQRESAALQQNLQELAADRMIERLVKLAR